MEGNITREKERVTWLDITKIRSLLWDRNFLQLIIKAIDKLDMNFTKEEDIQKWFDILQIQTLVSKYFKKLQEKEEISDKEKEYLILIFSDQWFLDTILRELELDTDLNLRFNNFFKLWRTSTDRIKKDLIDLLSLPERRKFTDNHILRISWSENNIDTANWEIVELNWIKVRINPEITIDWKTISARTIFEFIDWDYKWTQLFKPETIYLLGGKLWNAEELVKQVKKLYPNNIERWLEDCIIPLYGHLIDLDKDWNMTLSYDPDSNSRCNILCQNERSVTISKTTSLPYGISLNNPNHPEFWYDLNPNEIFLAFMNNQ